MSPEPTPTRRKAFRSCAFLLYIVLVLTVAAISLAIIIINQEGLCKVGKERWCNSSGKCEDRTVSGCQWTADITYEVPCDYCFSVGFLGLFGGLISLGFVQCLSSLCQLVAAEVPVMTAWGAFHVVWFGVAGSYFTKVFLNHRALPKDSTRYRIMGLIWACACLACVQLIVGLAGLATWEQLRKEQKLQQQQQQEQQLGTIQPPAGAFPNQYDTVPPPPPPLGYPAVATGGNVYLPPAPPSGTVYNAYTTPTRYAAAPLLGGYVNSSAVPPVGAGTAL